MKVPRLVHEFCFVFILLVYSGMHLAVILQNSNALDKLLQVVTKYPAFRNSIDDQNTLYQVSSTQQRRVFTWGGRVEHYMNT